MKRQKRSASGHLLVPSDFPACSGGDMLIMSEAAVRSVSGIIAQCGELLPLACEADEEYFAFNVAMLLDALNQEQSDVVRASDTGDILRIRRHVFEPQRILDVGLFKLPQMPRGLIYATQSFSRAVCGSSLTGLEFVSVWPSDVR